MINREYGVYFPRGEQPLGTVREMQRIYPDKSRWPLAATQFGKTWDVKFD